MLLLKPFVLRGFLKENDWQPFENWTLDYISHNFGRNSEDGPTVRIGSKQHSLGEILHDHMCSRHQFKDFGQMLAWMDGRDLADDDGQCSASTSTSSSSSIKVTSKTHWAYLDYKDVLELLGEKEAKQVDWSRLGVIQEGEANDCWRDSAIWIGTLGAYTPCHFDTYGFNLHAQLHGHKRWLLFPPCHNAELRPTRLPYEESSVFSSLDPIGGDPRIGADTMCWPVILNPGDLLFVPPKWWHSVQCVNNLGITDDKDSSGVCVSVNKWFPAAGDERESVKEALLKFAMGMYTDRGLLDPNEHVCLTERESIDELGELAFLLEMRLGAYTENKEEENGTATGTSPLEYFNAKFGKHPSAEHIQPVRWEKLSAGEDVLAETQRDDTVEALKYEVLDALSSSEVLDTLMEQIMKRRKDRKCKEIHK